MAGLSRDVRAGGGVWAGLGVVESSIGSGEVTSQLRGVMCFNESRVAAGQTCQQYPCNVSLW